MSFPKQRGVKGVSVVQENNQENDEESFMFNFLKIFSGRKNGQSKTDLVRSVILNELKKISIDATPEELDYPKNLSNGDFSFFIKDNSVDPTTLPIGQISHSYIEKVSVLGRFINFYLSKQFFADCLESVIEAKSGFGSNENLAGRKVIIEYTDPNLFKELHIGHLMSNTVGESLSRIIEWNGASISRAIYQSDVGLNVAKAIRGIIDLEKEKPVDTASLQEKISFIGRAYAHGSGLYENNPETKKEIDALNKIVYEKSDSQVNEIYDWGKEISLEHFEELYKKLGTKFDYYFLESEAAPIGLFAVEELLEKGILEKSEGAVVFKGERYGLHTRVFVNSLGLPTYETKELGLSKMKFDRKDWDQSIVITANEQTDYFTVVLKVLEFYDHRAANRTKHVSHGMLRFAEGKMSSRKGNVITGESLISDVEALVQEKIKDRDLPADEKDEIAEQVAVGAIKYSILKQSPGRDIIFDFEKSLSFEGDSGPYLQYTHARACSILRKAAEQKIHSDTSKISDQISDIEHLLIRFPAVVERAQKELAPQLITTYLTNLAAAFNHYYAEQVIVDAGKSESAYRIALTMAVKNVLGSGLWLLGIKSPERM